MAKRKLSKAEQARREQARYEREQRQKIIEEYASKPDPVFEPYRWILRAQKEAKAAIASGDKAAVARAKAETQKRLKDLDKSGKSGHALQHMQSLILEAARPWHKAEEHIAKVERQKMSPQELSAHYAAEAAKYREPRVTPQPSERAPKKEKPKAAEKAKPQIQTSKSGAKYIITPSGRKRYVGAKFLARHGGG